MIVCATERDVAEPRTQVFPVEGFSTYVTRYFAKEVDDLYAVAFIVEQEKNQLGGAHFHAADQFQLVIGGSGQYGKAWVKPYSVHYAQAFSPYGPIVTKDENLRWFTLRNMTDPGGIKWMPAERDQLKAAGRKPRVVQGEPEIPLQPDGLAVWRYQLKPGEKATGQSPATGRGQFWVAMDGTGTVAGNAFKPESLLFAVPSDPAVTVEAGPNGFDVLALQFPLHDK